MAYSDLTGAGIGQLAMLVPLYQSEISQPSIRGSLITLQQFMLGIGAVIATWVGYGCVKNHQAGRFTSHMSNVNRSFIDTPTCRTSRLASTTGSSAPAVHTSNALHSFIPGKSTMASLQVSSRNFTW